MKISGPPYRKQYSAFLLHLYILCVAFASAAIPFGGYYLKFDWLGMILISGYAFTLATQRGTLEPKSLLYVFIALVYLALNGLLAAIFGSASFRERPYWSYYFQFLLAFISFIAIINFRLSQFAIYKALRLWVGIACVASILAIIQVLSGKIIVDDFLFIPYYQGSAISWKFVAGILAATAWFSEASWFGSFLVVPIVFVAFQLSAQPITRRQYFRIFVFLLLMVGLSLGYSLTAIIAVSVGLLTIAILFPRSRWILAAVVLSIICVITYFGDTPRIALQIRRFSELWDSILNFSPGSLAYGTATSFFVRSIGFARGFSDFIGHPFFGVGLGQGSIVYDSGLITLLAEQGLIGCAIYYGLPIYVILCLSKLRNSADRTTAMLATFLVVGLIADYINGFITHHSFHAQRWLLVSMACSWLWSFPADKRKIQLISTGVRAT